MKNLIFNWKKKTAGRNSSGSITAFHRGGSPLRRNFRKIDMKRLSDTNSGGIIETIEYDPNRSANIARIRWVTCYTPKEETSYRFSYIIAFEGAKKGYKINNNNTTIGSWKPLQDIPIGTRIYNIETNFGEGAKYCRAAGSSAELIDKIEESNLAIVRLASGLQKSIHLQCRATIGRAMLPDIQQLKKAGQNRLLGRRPIVRGVAMNPIDHPHGGRTKGGRPSVSPWGKLTKSPRKKKKIK
uniref:Ribosomal protein L2 n=1 Tax=Chaetosphaeridium globosum TaxID=96477 RepID=Q8M1F8_CHAGL|nr:ribosomal protein L2 [Chaetosphaeridium globosum]AAM96614.1 ribosomal protein L2 [Chaetosphaeridium globosum]